MFHCITRGGSKGKAGGSAPPPHFILGKSKKKNRRRKAGKASDKQPGPPLSSRSGSATDYYHGKFI